MAALQVLLGRDPRELGGSLISVLGSGGKTSLLSWLARELSVHHRRVLLSTLTKVYPFPGIPCAESLEDLSRAFRDHRVLFLGRQVGSEGKREGLPVVTPHHLLEHADLVLLENDGARGRPLKVHLPHDPPVPAEADLALLAVGAAALGRPPDGETLHRAERAPAHWGLDPATPLSAEAICRVVLAPDGYLGKTAGVSLRILVNQADAHKAAASSLATELGRRWPGAILTGSARRGKFSVMENPGPRASLVVLAAGASQRYGADKRRALLGGKPLLERTLRAYGSARVLEKIVVLRPGDEELCPLAIRCSFRPVFCAAEETEMSASLKASLAAICPDADGLLVALGDMPQIREETVAALLEGVRSRMDCALRPRYRAVPGHPVYLPKRAFEAVAALSGDHGARDVLSDFDPSYMNSEDPGVVTDIDLPGDGREIEGHERI